MYLNKGKNMKHQGVNLYLDRGNFCNKLRKWDTHTHTNKINQSTMTQVKKKVWGESVFGSFLSVYLLDVF